MVFVSAIAIILAAILIVVAIQHMSGSRLLGYIAAVAFVIVMLVGVTKFEENAASDARVAMASAICHDTVTANADWQDMSIPALRNAAQNNAASAYLTEAEAAAVAAACYRSLEVEAAGA